MKNTSLILSVVALVAVVTLGVLQLTEKLTTNNEVAEETTETATKGDIVYIDIDRILMEYDFANDRRAVVETKGQNIMDEINRRGKKLESELKTFQDKYNKGLMTRSVAEAQSQKLQQQELDFNNYAAQKQQEMQEEQIVMMNQILDAIQTYIDKYNQEKQFAMILTNSGGAPVIAADPTLDVTDEVLKGLNEEYIQTKKNEKK